MDVGQGELPAGLVPPPLSSTTTLFFYIPLLLIGTRGRSITSTGIWINWTQVESKLQLYGILIACALVAMHI